MKYSLALLTLMVAATTAHAEGNSYSYENCLAHGGCGHAHSWKNGCCERERSCCDHLWDGYGCYDCCCDIHLPQMPKISWGCFHGCAAPYRVPCIRLPKVHLPHLKPCCTNACTDACTDACTSECGDACTEYACPAPCCPNPLRGFCDHVRGMFHGRCCLPAPCGCDTGCCGDAMSYGTSHGDADGHSLPLNEVPVPADMDMDIAPPIDLPPAPEQEDMNKKKKNKKNKDNKTAGLWLFPNLSL